MAPWNSSKLRNAALGSEGILPSHAPTGAKENAPCGAREGKMPSPPGPAASDLAVSYGGASLAGPRAINEDAFAAAPPNRLKGAVAVIADGVSSGEQAQKAAQTAVTEFIDEYLATPETWTVKTAAARVLNALNRWFCHHDGMATTFSAVIAKGRTAHIFHVGDSRIYRLRNGDFEQLTRDHRKQGMLTGALGAELHIEVDYLAEDLAPVTCSHLPRTAFTIF